jgi:hypothetical protein
MVRRRGIGNRLNPFVSVIGGILFFVDKAFDYFRKTDDDRFRFAAIRGDPVHFEGVQRPAFGPIIIPDPAEAVGITGGNEYAPGPLNIPLVKKDISPAVKGYLNGAVQSGLHSGFYKGIFFPKPGEYFFIIHTG